MNENDNSAELWETTPEMLDASASAILQPIKRLKIKILET